MSRVRGVVPAAIFLLLFLVVIAAVPDPSTASVHDQIGPVAVYSFDENEGEVAGDPAGGHDGAIEGAEWTRGKYGAALKFDGEDDCVTIPDAPDLQLDG